MSALDPTTAAAGADGLELLERFALPILLAAIAFAGAVAGVLLGQWAAERERRRAGYAAAARALIAWHEYPYRIRRRTDNDAETLRALAERGHELQEELRYHQTWTTAENRRVGEFYTRMVAEIAGRGACAVGGAEEGRAWPAGPSAWSRAFHARRRGWSATGVGTDSATGVGTDSASTLRRAACMRGCWRWRPLAVPPIGPDRC